MMKAAESISASNVKFLFGAHLLQHHMTIAETTAGAIRQRYDAFRQAIDGIEEYGIDIPPPSATANAFYLPLFLDRLLQRSSLSADDFSAICLDRYRLEAVPGTRMYPPLGPTQGTLSVSHGKCRIDTPGPVVYAPGFAGQQRPFLRVSFGIEHRIDEAAKRLLQACAETFVS
jgi:hypothetical protein